MGSPSGSGTLRVSDTPAAHSPSWLACRTQRSENPLEPERDHLERERQDELILAVLLLLNASGEAPLGSPTLYPAAIDHGVRGSKKGGRTTHAPFRVLARVMNESHEEEGPRTKHEAFDMQPRLDYHQKSSGAYKAMLGLERFVRECGLDHPLLELVKLRASQLNGCAYCIDMHTKDARRAGETEQRLYTLQVWEETPFFTDRERAALAWTEAVTRLWPDHVDDATFQRAREHFSEAELVNLTMAIVTINAWNRLAIAFRVEPGTYRPPEGPATATR